MKTLWVNSNFMHPTTKGGQIRTLEMLRHLHRWHEIHYVAIANPAQPEGPARAHEYSHKSYPFTYRVPSKTSPAFYAELVRGLFSPTPVAVARFNPPGMRAFLEDLIRKERFDCAVVDHLAPTSYFPDLPHAIFFQHNVETVIWRRHVEHASSPLRRAYFKLQADRMYRYERRVSRASGHIVAVSQTDAAEMRRLFDVTRVTEIPTGVNIDYFLPPTPLPAVTADLVFVGSMDWLPNVDGILHFVREILPLIRKHRPAATLTIVGRTPPPKITQLAAEDPAHPSHRHRRRHPSLPLEFRRLHRALAYRRRHPLENLRSHGRADPRSLHHHRRRGPLDQSPARHPNCRYPTTLRVPVSGTPRQSRNPRQHIPLSVRNGKRPFLLGAHRPLLRIHNENRPPPDGITLSTWILVMFSLRLTLCSLRLCVEETAPECGASPPLMLA